ncbi:hypothetical protein MM213_11250 [Belliella sp. R4-6]|uniref:Outer membrane protein beta-barrel domain-containing protein n=1 Tax=Belliella alkalica TaxID=1730871 RepID=A0ABS9VCA0_9BACT|nr:hypothetical protein [Belliella alkalica]MCH7414067.1 hypothetical protein [Belliella alkalica]
MRLKGFSLILFLLTYCEIAFGQAKYSLNIEAGHLQFRNTIVDVDPGPNWQGHPLSDRNGYELSVINGIIFRDKFNLGLGISYMGFYAASSSTHHGLAAFFNFEYANYKKKVSPLVNLKLGTGLLWNQYENGSRNFYGEITAGPMIKLSPKTQLYAKTGMMIQQQASVIPIKIGLRF